MSIYEQVLSFIHRPEPELFERLALAVFCHQYDSVVGYRHHCEEYGVKPATIRSIDEIPVVSNVAFKHADLAAEGEVPGALVFLTSGTTQGRERRGRHTVVRPEIYRASALAHLRTMLFPDHRKTAMLAIHPTADVMPESSLSTMISWCMEEFGTGARLSAASRARVDVDQAIQFLSEREARREPVCILGTTAAFSAIFEALSARGTKIRLAAGSRMMDTGGAKGQAALLRTPELIALAGNRLRIAPEYVINEYGMTELCSQLYDATPFNCPDAGLETERVKIPPPWLRVTARDPVTFKPQPDGEAGLLTFFDLANAGSVSAVMTEDIGSVEGKRVRVIGRAAMGAARGCALAIGQFAAAEAPR